ncbi:MAG: ABC transporter ATP-binding protein [Alphaproteobacteria bacterium]|nr:ABC transporter ATP-binding protein [Alphaproteobacteria bacterium]OJV16292.1 MAG: hypothetical protein BGO27_02960 [Alphaproteobacteria bacterium 33-17]
MLALDIKDLVKVYKGDKQEKIALNNLNLQVEKGSFFALLGPNGAGKSTTIDILAGLTIKTSGRVKICGLDLDNKFIDTRYKIGVVPQELMLDSFFSVKEILEYYAGYYGVKNSSKKIKELLERLNLVEKQNTLTHALSGGMKRRLLVAKALVHSPELVILDEPTAGVDIELRQNLWDYIKELNKEKGTTVIITTHYLEEAEMLCDQIAMINKGEIVAKDTTCNLIQKYTSKKFVVKLGSLQQVPNALRQYTVDAFENTLTITVNSDIPNSKVINDIFTGFTEIVDFKIETPSLEDVFRKLVYA